MTKRQSFFMLQYCNNNNTGSNCSSQALNNLLKYIKTGKKCKLYTNRRFNYEDLSSNLFFFFLKRHPN